MADLYQFLCTLSLAVARPSSHGVAICYILPVLWTTSCFHTMGSKGQNQSRRCVRTSPNNTRVQKGKGTALGCWLAAKTIPTAQNCAPVTNIPSKLSLLAVFGAWKTPCTEILNIFDGVCLSFGRNQCRISGQKAVLVVWQKKHVLAPLDDFPNFFWVRTMAPQLYSRFHWNLFRVWSYNLCWCRHFLKTRD